jgi:hypothetical protein
MYRGSVFAFAVCATFGGACPSGESEPGPVLLDGPERVEVQAFGPVTAPGVVGSDGVLAEVHWTVTPESVAVVREGRIEAVGAGEARVETVVDGQTVGWTLVVTPPMVLRFVDPPATVPVGSVTALPLDSGGATITAEWSSSDAAIADVDAAGQVTAKAAGTVYVTARAGNAEAMVELVVTAP